MAVRIQLKIYASQEPPLRCAFCYGLFEQDETYGHYETQPFHQACLTPMLQAREIESAVLETLDGEQSLMGYQPQYPRPGFFEGC